MEGKNRRRRHCYPPKADGVCLGATVFRDGHVSCRRQTLSTPRPISFRDLPAVQYHRNEIQDKRGHPISVGFLKCSTWLLPSLLSRPFDFTLSLSLCVFYYLTPSERQTFIYSVNLFSPARRQQFTRWPGHTVQINRNSLLDLNAFWDLD